jgi:hypothetical protein
MVLLDIEIELAVIELHAKTGFDTVTLAVFEVISFCPSDATAVAVFTSLEPGGPLTVSVTLHSTKSPASSMGLLGQFTVRFLPSDS